MDAEFVRERITQLRVRKDVSEYKMSYDLGHSANAPTESHRAGRCAVGERRTGGA